MRSSVGVTRWVRGEASIGDARRAREAWLHRRYNAVLSMACEGDTTAQALLHCTCKLLVQRALQAHRGESVVHLEQGWTVHFRGAHNDDGSLSGQPILTSPDGTEIDPLLLPDWGLRA